MWRRAKGKKYGNKKIIRKVQINGVIVEIKFDSLLESALFDLLSLQERAGGIRDLVHHPKSIPLAKARIAYSPDFRFINCQTEEEEWAEAKGYETTVWRLKRRLWIKDGGPGKLHIYRGSARRLILTETLNPKGEKDD